MKQMKFGDCLTQQVKKCILMLRLLIIVFRYTIGKEGLCFSRVFCMFFLDMFFISSNNFIYCMPVKTYYMKRTAENRFLVNLVYMSLLYLNVIL